MELVTIFFFDNNTSYKDLFTLLVFVKGPFLILRVLRS